MSYHRMRWKIENRLSEMTPDENQRKVYLEELSAEQTIGVGPWFQDEKGTYVIAESFD